MEWQRNWNKNVLEHTKKVFSSTFFRSLFPFCYICIMEKKYTIKDIAVLAGVSKGTVDRVLHKRGRVSENALEKVNAVLREIDYQPDLMARNLKNNKTYSIIVVMPDPSMDPYWSPALLGIAEAMEEFRQFKVTVTHFLYPPDSPKLYLETNSKVMLSKPDAVLLVPIFFKETLRILTDYRSNNILVTTFNSHVDSPYINSFVGQDLVQSGRVAAKLLNSVVREGLLAIVHIDEVLKNAVHIQEKEKGFRDYFSQVEGRYELVTVKLKNTSFAEDLPLFLKQHPKLTGIFVTTSKAYKVARVLEADRLSKIALVGYDLLEENLRFLRNGTIDFLIHQNPKRQAYLGVAHLVEHFLFNKEIPSTKLLPIDIINSENAVYQNL